MIVAMLEHWTADSSFCQATRMGKVSWTGFVFQKQCGQLTTKVVEMKQVLIWLRQD